MIKRSIAGGMYINFGDTATNIICTANAIIFSQPRVSLAWNVFQLAVRIFPLIFANPLDLYRAYTESIFVRAID